MAAERFFARKAITGYGCCWFSGGNPAPLWACCRLVDDCSSSPLPPPLWLPSEEVSRGLGITSARRGEPPCGPMFACSRSRAHALSCWFLGALFLRSRCRRFWNQICTLRGLMLSWTASDCRFSKLGSGSSSVHKGRNARQGWGTLCFRLIRPFDRPGGPKLAIKELSCSCVILQRLNLGIRLSSTSDMASTHALIADSARQ